MRWIVAVFVHDKLLMVFGVFVFIICSPNQSQIETLMEAVFRYFHRTTIDI